MKFKVEVGSFCTRMIVRKIIVFAENEESAKEKAIDKFYNLEHKLGSVDSGSPQVDFIEAID